MSKLNRFRWISWVVEVLFSIIFFAGMYFERPAAEALGITGLFAVIFLIAIRNRCPVCRRGLRLLPPLSEEEFCPYCGTRIE